MRKTIDDFKNEVKQNVALFHHVDGCYTVLAKSPEGAEPGSIFWTTDGKRLICKDVANLDDSPRHYRATFLVMDGDVIDETVYKKPKRSKATKATPVNDEIVGSMTKEPNS